MFHRVCFTTKLYFQAKNVTLLRRQLNWILLSTSARVQTQNTCFRLQQHVHMISIPARVQSENTFPTPTDLMISFMGWV